MSFAVSNLGEVEQLARAIGLVTGAGFNDDWLSRPGHYLGSVLAEDAQRDALLAVIDELLGGSARQTDARGQIWLPLFESQDPPISLYAVVDNQPADHIRIGLGVKLAAQSPEAAASLHLPLFKAGRASHSVDNPILLGQPGGIIDFTCDITVDTAAPSPGQAHLRAVGLLLQVPTDGTTPDFGIAVRGLQLPGATAARDITLSLANLAELDNIVLDLVIGLVEAQARQAGGAVRALARLIGISAGTPIPTLPLDQLAQHGLNAIADWAASIFRSAPARDAWLGELRDLLQNGATVNAGRVELPFGIGRVTIGVDVADGGGGFPAITPVLGIEAGAGQALARLEAKLFRLDLGARTAVALPALEVHGLFGRTPSGGAALLTGDPAVDAIRFGLSLDQNRRPAATLALINVRIGTHPVYPVLDLSSPSAVIEAAGQVIDDVLDQVLSALGPLQATLRTVLGLSVPAGIPGLTATSIPSFLGDPLGAVRSYWRDLILNHAAGVPLALTPLRDLIADNGTIATAVTGTGTPVDPWTIALVGPLKLQLWKAPAANRIEIALAVAYMNDTLGERCTRLDAGIGVGLLAIDLDGGPSSFLSSISAGLSGRPRGARRTAIEFPPLQISADNVGLSARWTPAAGLKIGFNAPNPAVTVNDIALPLEIPDLSAGFAALSEPQWDAIEFLAGQFARLTPSSWVADLTDALGWLPNMPGTPAPNRLRLAALVANPQAAILDWANTVLLRGASRIESLLGPLARVLTGSAGMTGSLYGNGRPRDPYRVPLTAIAGTPELTLWVEPDGPPLEFITTVTERLRAWRPGMSGLSPSELAEALIRETRAAPEIAAFVTGRADLGVGLGDLIERWTNTDGRILAPASEPAGVTVQLADTAFAGLFATLDLASTLASPATTIIRIAIAATPADAPWSAAPADRVIDLTTPSLVPDAFVQPAAAIGEWFVVLGPRNACRLASGDADGVAGQTARLQRILEPFRALAGGIAIVAEGGAGHAARRAADTIAEITALVTIGTPFGAVAFSVLAAEPAASTLRLLNALIPAETAADPFDEDLALGRDLVRGLLSLADTPALADELTPPADPLVAPRAGLEVHAVFGSLTAADISRALTAIFAAGLSTRAVTRAAQPFNVTGLGAGLYLPVSLGATGMIVRGHAALEFFGADLTGAPAVRQSRPLSVHLEIRRADGWLIGGPGSASGQDLRWLEFNMTLPLGSGGAAEAEVILHEPRIFSIRRDRWIIRHAGSASSGDEVVTTALPEVRVLLSGALRELSLDPDPQVVAALDLLEVSGVFSRTASGEGFVPAALDSILHQPDVHFRQLVEAAPSRQPLQAAINAIAAPISGITIDLAQRRFELALAGTPGTLGLLSWSLTAFTTAGGAFGGELRLGEPGSCLRLNLNPLAATVEWPRIDQATPAIIQAWPAPDVSRLVAELPSVLVASAIRLGLDYLRELDVTAKPIIDAALDALGFLSGSPGDQVRRVRVPLAFLSNPAAYFVSPSAFGGGVGTFAPAKAVAFLDALKPLLGLAGAPGEIQLAPGAAISVSGTTGSLRLGVTLDGAALATPPGNPPRLAFGGSFGLDIAGNGALRPTVDIFAGLSGAAAGRQAVHLSVADTARLFIRPSAGSDISLYPDPPGLGSVAGAALQVLPFALDEIAKITAPPDAATAARIVRAIGDALDLRSGAPLHFDSVKLEAWAANPAQRFADRLPLMLQSLLTELANAIGPALPAGLAISAPPNHLLLAAGPVTIDFTTAPFSVEIRVNAAGVPFAGNIVSTIAFDGAGLRSFTGTAGPASIPVNGIALHPFVAFAAGSNPLNGVRIETGSAMDAAGTNAIFARWNVTGGSFALVSKVGATESSVPQDVALALVRIALDLVAHFAFQEAAVQTLLDKAVPHTTAPGTKVKTLFRGVFLEDAPNPAALDPALFDPAQLLARFMRLLRNIAEAGPSIDVGGGIAIGMRLETQIIKLTLGVNGRVDLPTGDVRVSIEADSRWIQGAPAAALAIGFVDISGVAPAFRPSLSVNGIGLRVGKASGPLLDSVIKLGSVAAHFYADISQSQFSGGVQLQLSDLAVGAGGAGGGNAVAQGIMGDTGSGSNALAPAFSPALAVQKHGSGPVLVSLRAGEGDGPWWLSIQKGFGPLYVEQVGFGVTVRQDQLEKISILFDGRVSIAGLVASVDDLQITFTVTSGASLFEASRWAVDLGGLAVSADIAGVTLSGGLRKFGTEPDIEYVGMLMARVATYGLSIYGGYGTGVSDGVRFTAFFAFGAVTGPIGGPPAFFLTGIGGGFGINRDLIFPSSLATFADFVMIRALDPSASASSDPMQELLNVRNTFPMRRDRFWFAAGVSFTSFALVDGVAVVAISFGGGFELTLLGLARMALPRPQLRLVSIELGLIVRFSTRDGVMWIQAELTENSWLLHESVRLTGGFAYVMWFGGEHAGEFVLTLGGYHPNFHRDGYPQVPRLGFRWQVSDFISVKGENYFALTSEALMAGGALEASAKLGPAWASISFAANIIIYFDPFRYEGDAHARIAAGITIDLWLGEITISVHLGAIIVVAGPDFHGSVTFEVGPVELTVRFGGSDQNRYEPISWEAFVNKYLEAESPGVARVLTSITGKGSIPPGTGANGEEKGTADGSPEKPFEVFSEFELTITTIAPATRLVAGPTTRDVAPSGILGLAPVGAAAMSSIMALGLYPKASVGNAATDKIGTLRLASTSAGSFPLGAWGPVQPREDKKIPEGEVIDALNGALFVAEAKLEEPIPKEIAYNQVEAGPRHPLPFVTEKDDRARVLLGAKKLIDLVPANPTATQIYTKVTPWLADAGNTPLALASLRGGRAAPPMLGALGERLAAQTPTAAIELAKPDPAKTVDRAVQPPRAIGILAPLARREVKLRRTTVKEEMTRVLPPTMRDTDEMLAAGLPAKLLRIAPRAGLNQRTLIARRIVPLTRQARMAPAAAGGRGADIAALGRLKALSTGLARARAAAGDRTIAPGEVAILAMPNARRDSGFDARPSLEFKGSARVAMLGAGGGILADVTAESGVAMIPQGTERIAVWAEPADLATAISGLAGWHAGQSLAYVGWSTCLCGGGSVYSEAGKLRRGPESFTTGWIAAKEFVADSRLVTTRFTKPAQALVVMLDEFSGAIADFSLSLRGAAIALDGLGEEIAPVLLAQGTRRILVYALAPGQADFTVEILREGAVTVTGVMASAGSASVTAARLTETSAEALLDAPLTDPGDGAVLRFVKGGR